MASLVGSGPSVKSALNSFVFFSNPTAFGAEISSVDYRYKLASVASAIVHFWPGLGQQPQFY